MDYEIGCIIQILLQAPYSNFAFSSCGVKYTFPKTIDFAIVGNLSDIRYYVDGINLAFARENSQVLALGPTIKLSYVDDKGSTENALSYINSIRDNGPLALVLPTWSSEDFYSAVATAKIPIVNAPYIDSTMPSVVQLSPEFSDSIEYLFLHAFQGIPGTRHRSFSIVVQSRYSSYAESAAYVLSNRYGILIENTNTYDSGNAASTVNNGFIFVIGDIEFTTSALTALDRSNSKITGFLLPAPFVEATDLHDLSDSILIKTYVANNLPSFNDTNRAIPVLSEFNQAVKTSFTGDSVNQKTFVGYMTGRFIVEALKRTENKQDRLSFINAIYSSKNFQFGQISFTGFQAPVDQTTGLMLSENAFTSATYNESYCNLGSPYASIVNAAQEKSNYYSSVYSFDIFQTTSRCSNKLRAVKDCSLGSRVVLVTLASIGVACTLASIVWIYLARDLTVVKTSDYLMICNVLYGVGVLFIQVILSNVPISRSICVITAWLKVTGFTLVFVTMLVKTYRILTVFDPKAKKNSLGTNKWVLHSIIAASAAIVSIYYLIMGLVSPYSLKFVSTATENSLDCVQDGIGWTVVPIIYELIVLLAGIFVSIKSRKAWKAFNESKSNGLIIYNFLTATIIDVIIQFSGVSDTCVANGISSAISIYNAVVILVLTMFYKLKKRKLEVIETPMAEIRRTGSMDGIQFQKARNGSVDGINVHRGSSSNLAVLAQKTIASCLTSQMNRFWNFNSSLEAATACHRMSLNLKPSPNPRLLS